MVRLSGIPKEPAQFAEMSVVAGSSNHRHSPRKVEPLEESIGLVTSSADAFKDDRRWFGFQSIPEKALQVDARLTGKPEVPCGRRPFDRAPECYVAGLEQAARNADEEFVKRLELRNM